MVPLLNSIISRLRFKHMQLIIAIEDYGTLHKAAKAISISQPGATKLLNEIEESIGLKLFERTAKGIVPNEAGSCVTRYARLIFNDLSHMREEIVGIAEGAGGHIAVGCIMGAIPLLTRAIYDLRCDQPELTVEIFENNSANLLHKIDQGRIDFALCRVSSGQNILPYDNLGLSEEPLAIVANTAHPLLNCKNVSLAELADHPWVLYTSNTPMRQSIEYEMHKLGLEIIKHPVESSSAFSTIMLLQHDVNLLAVLPLDVAEFFVSKNLISLLDIKITSLMSKIGIVKRKDFNLTPTAHILIAKLYQNLGLAYDKSDWHRK
ncbi:Chromosome initiation inhibitor [Marinobacterium lacunae]|uniref:Chromosome initiation inhibitor n=1 Tax=Marinobacterium lacunae TaxID=1232683 RepID=A0A081FUL0_9GAMM|nr:LysR family transcriptional regulator [Marinobacterium lacunae]KEA62215.1 Chromosome initiation inhibitor [Marinobacterium lacunae]